MRTVLRFDRGALQRPTRTPQGFLRVEGYVGRAGIYEYRTDDNGKPLATPRRELRPDAEVFAAKVLAQFASAPITIGHPRKPNGDPIPVTKDNVKQYEVGNVDGAARRDGDRAAAALVVKDAKAIKAVEAGKQELSPGYSIDLDERPGVDPKYGRYDAIQHNIVINHLALVDHARGGSALRLRMDETDRADADGRLTTSVLGHQHLIDLDPQYGSRMSGCTSWAVAEGAEGPHEHAWVRNSDGTITVAEAAGHKHDILDGAAVIAQRSDGQIDRLRAVTESGRMANANAAMEPDEQIRSLKTQVTEFETKAKEHEESARKAATRADAAEAKLHTAQQENSDLRSQIAASATVVETEAIIREKIRADEAEAKVVQFDATFSDRVKARVALERKAAVIMGPEFRMDDLSDREILASTVKRLDAQADTAAAVSDAFLTGRFESLIELHGRNARSQQRVADVITGGNVQRADDREIKRREFRDQWKQPLPNDPRAKKGN